MINGRAQQHELSAILAEAARKGQRAITIVSIVAFTTKRS